MSSDGELLMVNNASHSLMIYESDAELIRSIRLPVDIVYACHAVETSTRNFIVIHTEEEKKMVAEVEKETVEHKERLERIDEDGESNRRKSLLGISQLTRDGQMISRRIIALNEPRQLTFHDYYISLDSDDRVFVADRDNDRVILLDSDLKWSRILCSTNEEIEDRKIRLPRRLFYDEKTKQLIVGGSLGNEVNVYTLSRN